MLYTDPDDPEGPRPPKIVNFNDSLGYVLRALREKLQARGETCDRVEVIGSVTRVSVTFAEIEEHTKPTDTDWENKLAGAKDAAL